MHTECQASTSAWRSSLLPVTAAQTGELVYRNQEVGAMWENAQNVFSLVIYSHLPLLHPQVYKAKLNMKLTFSFHL